MDVAQYLRDNSHILEFLFEKLKKEIMTKTFEKLSNSTLPEDSDSDLSDEMSSPQQYWDEECVRKVQRKLVALKKEAKEDETGINGWIKVL